MPYLAKSFRNVSKNSTNIYKTKQTNKVNPVKYTSLGKYPWEKFYSYLQEYDKIYVK